METSVRAGLQRSEDIAKMAPRVKVYLIITRRNVMRVRYDRTSWIVEPVTPAAYPPA